MGTILRRVRSLPVGLPVTGCGSGHEPVAATGSRASADSDERAMDLNRQPLKLLNDPRTSVRQLAAVLELCRAHMLKLASRAPSPRPSPTLGGEPDMP